jgi:hypothetical protein
MERCVKHGSGDDDKMHRLKSGWCVEIEIDFLFAYIYLLSYRCCNSIRRRTLAGIEIWSHAINRKQASLAAVCLW